MAFRSWNTGRDMLPACGLLQPLSSVSLTHWTLEVWADSFGSAARTPAGPRPASSRGSGERRAPRPLRPPLALTHWQPLWSSGLGEDPPPLLTL